MAASPPVSPCRLAECVVPARPSGGADQTRPTPVPSVGSPLGFVRQLRNACEEKTWGLF